MHTFPSTCPLVCCISPAAITAAAALPQVISAEASLEPAVQQHASPAHQATPLGGHGLLQQLAGIALHVRGPGKVCAWDWRRMHQCFFFFFFSNYIFLGDEHS